MYLTGKFLAGIIYTDWIFLTGKIHPNWIFVTGIFDWLDIFPAGWKSLPGIVLLNGYVLLENFLLE